MGSIKEKKSCLKSTLLCIKEKKRSYTNSSFCPSHCVCVPPSFHLSIQSSGSCSFQEQQRILGLFELSPEFKQQHYLTGLLLTELSAALDMESEGYGNIVIPRILTSL